ncbi:hypothetical protein M1615_02970 [Patescibacteria group bacterium]|nr:hypothetical protein [Patescibacteria group bacterium]
MGNKILLAIFFIAALTIIPQKAYSQEKASASSADIKTFQSVTESSDYRVKILKKYLLKQHSPLAKNAQDFIYYADEYNLDWRLVAAIAGVESTFGKSIPPSSYNGWGWGVYGDNVIRFSSWKEGIQTVSAGLRQRYMDKWGGQNIYQIGSMYASSPVWASHVLYYLNDIQKFALNDPKDSLSLTL